jgi:hypothetical protein
MSWVSCLRKKHYRLNVCRACVCASGPDICLYTSTAYTCNHSVSLVLKSVYNSIAISTAAVWQLVHAEFRKLLLAGSHLSTWHLISMCAVTRCSEVCAWCNRLAGIEPLPVLNLWQGLFVARLGRDTAYVCLCGALWQGHIRANIPSSSVGSSMGRRLELELAAGLSVVDVGTECPQALLLCILWAHNRRPADLQLAQPNVPVSETGCCPHRCCMAPPTACIGPPRTCSLSVADISIHTALQLLPLLCMGSGSRISGGN